MQTRTQYGTHKPHLEFADSRCRALDVLSQGRELVGFGRVQLEQTFEVEPT
jgi:hypothetical protein